MDDFRRISLELTRTHFRENDGSNGKRIGRCEFIPVYWHELLHGSETGIDQRLQSITLKTVPKLRQFVNDSLLDALFYTSPIYCQHIINTVSEEINRLYDLFITRNPYFRGTVSLSGHSLGSVILFDLLANQNGAEETSLSPSDESWLSASQNKKMTDSVVYSARTLSYGQEGIKYPRLKFRTDCFFALGSPISMFLTLRGITQIDEEFRFPDCSHVYNIFHPLDPIAYRIEPMLRREFINLAPVIVPHHRGRKRMHLEIKDNLAKISSDIKEKVLFGIKSTWNSVGNLKNFVGMPRSSSNLSEINEQLNNPANQATGDEPACDLQKMNGEENDLYDYSPSPSNGSAQPASGRTGSLNNGSRIDYVLQEKPIEFFNQYIFALATHACYWTSEDCILFIISKLVSLNSSASSMDAPTAEDQTGQNQSGEPLQQTASYTSSERSYGNLMSTTMTPASSQMTAFNSPFDATSFGQTNQTNQQPSTNRPSSASQQRLSSPVLSPDHISTSIDIE